MVSRASGCNPSRLKHLLNDELPALEQAELVGHLDTCAACQARLEELAAESRLWGDLRHLARPTGPMRRGRDRETEVLGPAGHDDSGDEGVPLGFLAPTDDPASLGRLGPYEVTDVLGRGGMGMVLKAFDAALNRPVAIKVLAPQLATVAAARKRFAREAKAAAAVVHDHVVAIHAVDVDPYSGLPYLVMPFVSCRSLQERIDRDGPLEAKEILRIGMQAARGLAAAHEQGLVHRDVKPSNILLENGVERVTLTDFGLARAVDDASVTQSGVVAGTPQYMAPEQARGDAVDHRADLFSLGSVLYTMAAGHPPFRSDSALAVLRRVCDERPRPLREVNPDIPEPLEAVIERLHAKDPADRYQSAPDVAEVLGRLLADLQRPRTAAVARTPIAAPRPGSRVRRRRTALVTLAAVVVALALAEATGMTRSVAWLLPIMPRTNSTPGERTVLAPSPEPRADDAPGGGARSVTRPASVTINDNGAAGDAATIVGSGNPATKHWDLSGFDAVEVVHPFRVEITRAEAHDVTITADDNVLDHIKVSKEGRGLKIALEEGKSYRLGRGSLKATIALPALREVRLSSGVRGVLRGFKSADGFKAWIAHGSELEGTIEAGDVDLEVGHGSSLDLRGAAKAGTLSAMHGSHLDLADLTLHSAKVRVAHGSEATLGARGSGDFAAKIEHGSTLKGTVEADEVVIEATHGSHATLGGKAHRARLVAGHGSQLDLGRLALDAADATLTQASEATVNAQSTLDYRIHQASNLKYLGKPKIGKAESSQASSARSAREEDLPKPEAQRPSAPRPVRHEDAEKSTIHIRTSGGPQGSVVVASGKLETKTFDLKDFNAIDIHSLFTAEVTRADSFKVEVTADDNLFKYIKVVKDGATLRIGLDAPDVSIQSPDHKLKLKATITLPALEGITVSGASRATIAGFKSDRPFRALIRGASQLEGSVSAGDVDLRLEGASKVVLRGSARDAKLSASGACHVQLADFSIDAERLVVDVEGASTATLRGSARVAALRAVGASRLDLAQLALDAADVTLSGTSTANVNAKQLLDYSVSGVSKLEYRGDPKIGKAEKDKMSAVHHAT